MQFQMTGIGSVPFVVRPFADRTPIFITPKNLSFDRIWDSAVMLRALPIRLQKVDPHFKTRAAGVPSDDGPAVIRCATLGLSFPIPIYLSPDTSIPRRLLLYLLSPTLFEPESPEVCGFAGPAGSVGATGRKSSTG